jgi:hypothetical protein
LAPYGLSGTLTGVSYKTADHSVAKLLKEWERFYPLDRNKYFTRDSQVSNFFPSSRLFRKS